jgi:hypothetical protein
VGGSGGGGGGSGGGGGGGGWRGGGGQRTAAQGCKSDWSEGTQGWQEKADSRCKSLLPQAPGPRLSRAPWGGHCFGGLRVFSNKAARIGSSVGAVGGR